MSNRSSNRSPSPPGLDDEKIRHTEEVLRSLFTGNLTVEEAATKLAATTIPDPNIDLEDCEEDLQVLWGRMLAYPMEPPSRVNTVASLILYISQLPPPITVSGKQLVVNEGTLRVWDDTPTLGWALHDEWNGETLTLSAAFCFSVRLIPLTSQSARKRQPCQTSSNNKPLRGDECTNRKIDDIR